MKSHILKGISNQKNYKFSNHYTTLTASHTRDGVSTIQMYSNTSTINLNMHEYEYSENKCTRIRLLYNVLKYDYIRM